MYLSLLYCHARTLHCSSNVSKRDLMYYRHILLVVIQQLRGPNDTQFWPPTLLEWTIGNILHNTYSLFTWPSMDFLLTTYPRPSSFPHSYWMSPWTKTHKRFPLNWNVALARLKPTTKGAFCDFWKVDNAWTNGE